MAVLRTEAAARRAARRVYQPPAPQVGVARTYVEWYGVWPIVLAVLAAALFAAAVFSAAGWV